MGISTETEQVYYGEMIRRYRTYQGMTQRELASKIRVAPPQVSQYENGIHQPTPIMLSHIARVLGVTTAHLMGEVPFLAPWPGDKKA